jgi:hypothetical protein
MTKVLIHRTATPNNPPAALAAGELSIEMAVPCRLWVGVPTSLNPAGMKLLLQIGDEEAQFVDVIGDTMTGALILSGIPVSDLQAATKKYVDNLSGTASGTVNGKVAKAGDTMTGLLTLPVDPVADFQASTKQYVDGKAGSIVQPPPFGAGTVVPFWQAVAPVGWTKVTTQNDKALRVVSGNGGVAGGTNPFSTVMAQTLTGNFTTGETYEVVHSHSSYAAAWGGGLTQSTTWTGNNPQGYTPATSTGGSAAHNHGLTMAIQYVDVIIASKD